MAKWKIYYSDSCQEYCIEIPKGNSFGFRESYFNNNTKYFRLNFNLSQEEIDAIMKELKDAKLKKSDQQYLPGINFAPVKDSQLDFGLEKKHKCTWKLYTGLFEQYEMCFECGKKK